MSSITPFSAAISQQEIDDLSLRLSLTRLPEKETVDDWSQGVPLSYLRDLLQHWQHNYAFDRFARRLNAFPQFRATIDGMDIHFIHARSAEPEARPLLITHGWPGSVLEFMQVIAPLTDPVAHGGNAEDAFHVICPSLPGFGLSGKPEGRSWGIDRITRAWMKLMQQLGYSRYFAQGGDWGSGITTHLGRLDTEHCACIHLNLLNARPTRDQRDDLTEEEQSCLESLEQYNRWDSGYRWQQSTRPQTLGYGLTDSPVGQLAWIIEKFHAWTDCDGHPENAISRDDMLDNVMLYWLSATAASSARLYWESTHTAFAPSPVSTPTGISIFPKDTHRGSRRWAESGYTNIVYWNRLERGGHFAAMEQPDLFVNELRACFRTQR